MNFADRNVLITGASRGIGRAAALAVAEHGGNVAINYRSHADEAEQVADAVRSRGGRALLCQADVSDQTAVDGMIDQVVGEFGRLDGFVSNAAFSERELLVAAEMEGLRRTVDVSMWGAFYGIRAAARHMIDNDVQGAMVVVSSPHAVIPFPTAIAYNMAKAAIDQMARTAATELVRHRIRVNIIHPGWIDTPGERKFCTEEQLEESGAALPWGRLGRADEIGRAIAWMLSDETEYMTGSTVTIDGGISLPWWSDRSDGGL